MTTLKFRNNEYKLERTAHSFILNRKTIEKKEGNTNIVYATVGHYNSLSYVFKQLFDLHVLDNVETKSLLECVQSTYKDIELLLKDKP